MEKKTKYFPDDNSTVSQISGRSSKCIAQSVMAVPINDGQQPPLLINFELPKTSNDVIFAIEYYVQLFEKYGQVLKLVPYLPQKQPQLEPECYESAIQQALGRLRSQLSREDRIFIIQALARLFGFERQYDKALALFLQLKDTGIFSFIQQYHLFALVKNQVVELMEINADLAVCSPLDQTKIADFKTIVPQLSKMPRIQMEYLYQLISRRKRYELADLLVKLFAENSPERLLTFLKKSDGYDLDKAIDICKKKKLQHELVFLLKRKKYLAFSIFYVLDGTLIFCRQYV
uniref:Mic1 domain-containing protein n=1 Tax=Panagrolaimus sp. JU765 TaxID=591449 RepID=A0AC34QCV3_9BILA